MKKLFLKIGCFLFAWFALHTAYIVSDGLHDHIGKADVAFVLGNKVQSNGQPSPRLKARLDRALMLYRDGLIGKIVVTGGVGDEGYNEPDTMAKYLQHHGVKSADIIRDPTGKNTMKTAQAAKKIMEQGSYKTIMIISQYYHITRTRLAFRINGMEPDFQAHALYFEPDDFYSILREFVGYYAYLFRYHAA